MDLHPVLLGDGARTATGWLVLSHGAVRAVLTPADDGIWLQFACDRRARSPEGCLRFHGLQEARSWLERRLEPESTEGKDGEDRA